MDNLMKLGFFSVGFCVSYSVGLRRGSECNGVTPLAHLLLAELVSLGLNKPESCSFCVDVLRAFLVIVLGFLYPGYCI